MWETSIKIILSRKGFDAAYGGAPSPILPDGCLVSLPIPCARSPITYEDLHLGDLCLGQLVQDLTHGRIRADHSAHLDPDLRPEIYPRAEGWRPLFGQAGAAQAHLAAQGVGAGDLMLFFGWFREVEQTRGRYRYVRGAPDLHVVYGWMRVGEVWSLQGEGRPRACRSGQAGKREAPGLLPPSHAEPNTLGQGRGAGGECLPPWAAYHPHCHGPSPSLNALYVAAGGGIVDHYAQRLCLTAPGATRSMWRLPAWLAPQGRPPLTYHADPRRWTPLDDQHLLLHSASRGQEFVLDAVQYPEAEPWARRLIGEEF